MHKDPLRWFVFWNDDEHPWTVYLATEQGAPFLEGLAGICFKEERTIYVSVHEEDALQISTVLHEMDHANHHGCDGPRVKRLHYRTEERIVRYREPRILTMTKTMGWKLPRRPRGFGALRAMAIEINDARGGR